MLQALRYAGAALLVLLNGDKHIMCATLLLTCGGVLVAARLGFIGAILGVSLCNLGAGARHKKSPQ